LKTRCDKPSDNYFGRGRINDKFIRLKPGLTVSRLRIPGEFSDALLPRRQPLIDHLGNKFWAPVKMTGLTMKKSSMVNYLPIGWLESVLLRQLRVGHCPVRGQKVDTGRAGDWWNELILRIFRVKLLQIGLIYCGFVMF